MLLDLFKEVNKIQDLINTSFIEVSVKQHQIDISFKKDDCLYLYDLNKIKHLFEQNHKFETPYIVSFEEEVHFVFPEIQNRGTESHIFMKAIQKIADEVCQCPSLEFVISPMYLKCYLDKPGLFVEDLEKYDEIFQESGTLELHTQRPYMLYIYYNMVEKNDE